MFNGQPLFTRYLLRAMIAGLVTFIFYSCAVIPQNYPRRTPFVYEYNINVEGNLTEQEKSDLESALQKQLDDSIGVRTKRKLISSGGFNRQILNKPPVYNSMNADKSVTYMKALMVSLGYFYDSVGYRTKIDTAGSKDDQYRVNVIFDVKTGLLTRLDSIAYRIDSPRYHHNQAELQSLTKANLKESYLTKGMPFAKGIISAEFDRLVELYRNNGFLRFGREDLLGVWDTLDVALLQPSLDPFEQIELLQKLKERRLKPTAKLEIRMRPGFDSVKLVKYYVGKIEIYPDFIIDSLAGNRVVTQLNPHLSIIQFNNTYKPNIFLDNIYLRHGDLYAQRRFQRTINRLNVFGTWKQINIEPVPRVGQDTVDFRIFLNPAPKYVFNANLEASQNQSAISGSLFGIGANVGLQNRNVFRGANTSSLNMRYGIELGDSSFIQTQQVNFSYKLYFPKPVPNFKFIPERHRDNIRTVFGFSAANTERRNLFNLTTVNASLGYEFQRNVPRSNKTLFVTLKPVNIEYSYLKKRQGLIDLINTTPALNNVFTDGLISSLVAGITHTWIKGRRQNILAVNYEQSGLLAGMFRNEFLDSQLYRFVKIDAELTKLIKFKKTAIAIRAFAGVGYELGSTANPLKQDRLPFFKQYFAGGPNSMRAWSLRRLGPGSLISDFKNNPERYGDVQLELNAEYRFNFFRIAGFTVESVLFTDIGNVWFLKKEAGSPETVFNLGRLGKDLAVGVGTGLRIDLSFFMIRLDYAFKAKDPSPSPDRAASQNKWFYGYQLSNLLKGQLQLGVNYPFKL